MHQFHILAPKGYIYILSLYRILNQYIFLNLNSYVCNMNMTISAKITSTNFVPIAVENAKEDKI